MFFLSFEELLEMLIYKCITIRGNCFADTTPSRKLNKSIAKSIVNKADYLIINDVILKFNIVL